MEMHQHKSESQLLNKDFVKEIEKDDTVHRDCESEESMLCIVYTSVGSWVSVDGGICEMSSAYGNV